MPRLLTEDALVQCDHGRGSERLGRVRLQPVQDWLTIGGRRVLVEGDLRPRAIAGCPMRTPTTPPCLHTISVSDAPSHAAFVTARSRGGTTRRILLDTATGRTDWAQSGTVGWHVARPGQSLVVAGGKG